MYQLEMVTASNVSMKTHRGITLWIKLLRILSILWSSSTWSFHNTEKETFTLQVLTLQLGCIFLTLPKRLRMLNMETLKIANLSLFSLRISMIEDGLTTLNWKVLCWEILNLIKHNLDLPQDNLLKRLICWTIPLFHGVWTNLLHNVSKL